MRRWISWLWTWLKDSVVHLRGNPAALGIVAIAGVLGIGAAIVPGEAGFHYVWRDPHMCNDCHVHDYADEAFFRSIHNELTTCHDCHRVPIMHYPRNLVMTPMSTGEELAHRPHVESVICSACHMEGEHHELTGPMTPRLLQRIVKVDHSPLHMVHLNAEERDPGTGRGAVHGAAGGDDHGDDHAGNGHSDESAGHRPETERVIACMDCHGGPSNRAHRFEASRENCISCHEGIADGGGRLDQLQCQECHFEGFLGKAPNGDGAAHDGAAEAH